MKKPVYAVVILGLLAVSGFFLYQRCVAPTETRACVRLGQLCDSDLSAEGLERCEALMERLTRAGGPKSLEKSVRCIMDSESCAAGLGCVVGTGLGAFTEFFKGAANAVKGE